MVFSSSVFMFIFLPLVLIVYYNPILKNRKFKNFVLLVSSIGFYAYGEPVYFILMLMSITLNWGLGLLINLNRKYAKAIVIIAGFYNIGLLFWFKYINFTLENIGFLLHRQFPIKDIVLPIGISFYTFQALSYVIDVYYEKIEVQKNWMNMGVYISCFPQLIAGPIVRYNTIAREINERDENLSEFIQGTIRFSYGLAKKVIIANNLAIVADAAFDNPIQSMAMAWLGAVAYSLQIYYDFSGYSDMAIGLGRMFGFHFPENFQYPYTARSITEFWKKWHISLTQWFRDYLYIPLGGNRVKKGRHIFNLCVVWLFTGLWHGANWTFILWGIIYLIMQLLEKFTGFYKKINAFGHVYTLLIVMLCWVIFRASSISTALRYIGCMFGVGVETILDGKAIHYLLNYFWYFVFGIIFSMPIFPRIVKWSEESCWKKIFFQILMSLLFICTVSFVLSSEYDPFIYFNF